MEPYVHEKDEGTKKVIIAASGNSHCGLRTRCAKSPTVTSPKRTRNRAKTSNGTSNSNVLNGNLMKSSWSHPDGGSNLPLTASPEKNPLHYAAGMLHFNPRMETGHSNSKFVSASPDSRVARFNATLFSSATRHVNQGLDMEEAMDIDHQETDDEAVKRATQPFSSPVSKVSSPAPSEDKCNSSKRQGVVSCTEEQATTTKGRELKDSSSTSQKKEASKNVAVAISKSPLKTKAISQSKKSRAIYIVLHVSTVRIGEIVGKASAPVKIYGEKIFIEMETADGSSENKTYNFRIPWKDLAECKASLSGWPLLILVKPTAFGATAIVGKLKGKGQFLDPESKDVNKRSIVLLMNYKEIPRDVKSDLIELFQNRLAGQLTWSHLSPNEAQQLLAGKEEEASSCSPNRPPQLASPTRPEERKILTPKGKSNRKKLFTDATNASEAKASAPRIATRAENSSVGQDNAPTQAIEELSDYTVVQPQNIRGKLPAATSMDTDKPASAGSEPVKPDILLHHKEMESHITLLDQHSKEQRENLEEHQKLLEIERGKLRAIEVENDRHIGRMRDLEISFSTDKLNLLQRIKSLQTTLAEKDQAVAEQTLEMALLREELERKETSLRQLNRELSQQSEANHHLRNLEGELIQARRALDEEKVIRNMREQQLRDKETMVHELQRNVSQEQQARLRSDSELHRERTSFTQLEERLESERRSLLSIEHDLRTKEETIAEQRRLLEQERQQKAALDDRLRNVQQELECERNMRVNSSRELLQERSNLEQCRSNLERERAARNEESRNHQRAANESDQRIRDLQISLSATQDVVAEYHRLEPRDWIIRRDEVQLSEKSLGVGAWGTVCEGTFRGCQVAVKQIHELILSPHNRRLFEREMSIASRCRHPNLLQFIGATNDDGSPLFITELLDTDLRKVLSRRALLQEEIVCIAVDVARGLNYLHLNKPFPIIHRDISSSNVLLWRRDESWRAKLSDYGAANFLRQCMTANAGALIYAAPESLTSQQSPKADVFSFGLLLCEMCVRELPVPQQIQDQINLVSHGVLRELIMRCVEGSPEARPSMSEVINVLVQQTECLRTQGLVSINGRSTAL